MGRIGFGFTRSARWVLSGAALILSVGTASAQVVINEIYANPPGDESSTMSPSYGTERVEIYNAGPTAVDMTGWAIDDLATIDAVGVRCRIPEDFDTAVCPGSVIIQPGEFRLLKGTTATAWINNSNETIYLVTSRVVAPVVVSSVNYGASVEGSSYSAVPNGTTNFLWRPLTLCATNGSLGDIAPAAIADLAASPGLYPGEIQLTWTAPGADGMTGTASLYQIRVGYAPIVEGTFGAGANIERWINALIPAAAGTPETLRVSGMSPDTTYYFAIKTKDDVPNTSAISNSPGVAPLAGVPLNPDLGYNVYFGNLHSHTSYSDGVLTPTDAFFYARNTAQTPLDFLEVSEHNHASIGMSLPSYSLGLLQADAANSDGNFVALYGQEWGLASHGHVNVIASTKLIGWDAGNYDVFVAEGDYAGLYTAALANPPADGYPVILEWCHPAAGDFSNQLVTPDGLAAVHLMALVNGPAFSTSTTESDIGNTNFDGAFHDALRRGYRVSPTADQDNHEATWGASSQSRTAVLATAKTRGDILSGLAARRAYATQDHNVDVDFSANGHVMGEAFTTQTGVRIAVRVTDPDPTDAVAEINLYRGITGVSTAVRVAWSAGNSEFAWHEPTTFTPGTEAHYYLRIVMADNQSIWTGPVYVTYDPASPAAVGETPRSNDLALAAHPIPARGNVTAEFTLPRPEGRVRLSVYDLTGRKIRTLWDRSLEAGAHRLEWNGTTDRGERVPGGVFFLRLETSTGSVGKKILLVR